jgi:hypothetical protein
LAAQASRQLRRRQYLAVLGSLGQAAAAIFSSWRATRSLFGPHVWRNYRTASRLQRHAAKAETGSL